LVEKKHKAKNLWDGKEFKSSTQVEIALPAHGSTVLEVR
jgi:hypothetical protein